MLRALAGGGEKAGKAGGKIFLWRNPVGGTFVRRWFPAVTLDNLLGNREAKACTGCIFAPRRIGPEKRFKYARHAIVGDARSFIIDRDRRGAVAFQAYADKGATAMGCRIDDEISDCPR